MKLFSFGLAVGVVGYFLWEKFDVTGKIVRLFSKEKKAAKDYAEKEISKVKRIF